MVKTMMNGNWMFDEVVGQEAIQLSDWDLESLAGGTGPLVGIPRGGKLQVRVKSTGFDQDFEEFSPAEILQIRVKEGSPIHETFGVRV
jgi:hypothetical protein